MSVILHGGGSGAALSASLEGLVREAAARSRREGAPLLACVVAAGGGTLASYQRGWENAIREAGGEARMLVVPRDASGTPEREIDLAELTTADALVVAGGLTPGYLEALAPLSTDIRRLVSEGMPYLGSSAGAMIAATSALVGGWRIGGVPVAREEWSEGLDEVELREGLGLIDVTIDVHAVEQGLLTRAIAAVEAGLADAVLAIDEGASLVVAEGALEILGAGSVWRAVATEDGVAVCSDRAA